MALRDTTDGHSALPIRLVPAAATHTGKRYFLTGAARGLGAGIARLLTAQGAKVWGADLLVDELATVAAEGALAGCSFLDVGSPDSITRAVNEAAAGLGGFDGAVNVAGFARPGEPLDADWALWQRTFEINVFGSYEVARRVSAHMIADNCHGAIVNTASEAGKVGHVDSLPYSASKAAVISMTRMLSVALAPHDINVNCVCPGGMPTQMLRDVARNYAATLGGDENTLFDRLISTQLRRHTSIEEVAAIYSFLLTDAAAMIRGQAVNADAGDTPY
ncbi:MAG: SDR family oxidoreductase [Gordonia sp. (in: high G+C Gram-positive bacteria)]